MADYNARQVVAAVANVPPSGGLPRLALPGLHLGERSVEQRLTAHQLDRVVPKTDLSSGSLAHDLTGCLMSAPVVYPKIDDIVEENVGEEAVQEEGQVLPP